MPDLPHRPACPVCHLLHRDREKSRIVQAVHHVLQKLPLLFAKTVPGKLIKQEIADLILVLHGDILPSLILFFYHFFIIPSIGQSLFICLVDLFLPGSHAVCPADIQQRIFQILILQKLIQFHTVHGQNLQ